MKYLFFSILYLSPSVLLAKTWDKFTSAPEIMGSDYIKNFDKIPLEGRVKSNSKYWSGHYWPNKEGSINNRWNIGKFRYLPELLTKEEAKKLSIPELSALSASEKLDLLNGNYNHPLTYEVAKYYNPRAQSWEGICHGWSAASLNHNEPHPKILTNPDGMEIPFGSSDIKALLSYYYAFEYHPYDTYQMGRRCEESKNFTTFECTDDLNPGAFHVVLSNRVGIEGKSFIADTDRAYMVSNHPIWSFSSKTIGKLPPQNTSAPGTARVVRIKTVVVYVKGNGVNWRPILNTREQAWVNETYEYYLELDPQNNIIGGEWISWNRPDFLWRMEKPRAFGGHFKQLPELLSNE